VLVGTMEPCTMVSGSVILTTGYQHTGAGQGVIGTEGQRNRPLP
jgi:hypothetical protein